MSQIIDIETEPKVNKLRVCLKGFSLLLGLLSENGMISVLVLDQRVLESGGAEIYNATEFVFRLCVSSCM